ncbi:hypothetical protein GCM10023311_03630 [Flaviramulus aquimarinus]|uniref:DUF4136 domain-containing protein n=1 Tax=Flaviramulus aquimarinus TaxID=1170456 RepID=A0ABP9ESW9_9FLAO
MKFLRIITICLLVISCSTTELVDNWKNPDIDSYSPKKVLIVGMTANLKARRQFEKQLQLEYASRGIESVSSLEFFKPSFTNEKQTDEDLKTLESNFIKDGFDTIIFTKVIGVEDIISYKENYNGYESTHRKFREDYLKYQDAFYNPDYYKEYTVYHTETSMYCICPTKDRELIWKGYIDIMDPQSITETVNDYVRLVVVILEELQLINPIVLKDNKFEET